MNDLVELLKRALQAGASDVILSAGTAPHFRVDGELGKTGSAVLDDKATKKVIYGLLSEAQIARLVGCQG